MGDGKPELNCNDNNIHELNSWPSLTSCRHRNSTQIYDTHQNNSIKSMKKANHQTATIYLNWKQLCGIIDSYLKSIITVPSIFILQWKHLNAGIYNLRTTCFAIHKAMLWIINGIVPQLELSIKCILIYNARHLLRIPIKCFSSEHPVTLVHSISNTDCAVHSEH